MRTHSLIGCLVVTSIALAAGGEPSAAQGDGQPVLVDVVKQPYKGARNVPELSLNPDYIHAAGLERMLESWGAELARPVQSVLLTSEEQREYGEGHRLGLANEHMAASVAELFGRVALTVGLEANCSSLLGMLGGLQRRPDGSHRRVGLVFIDAHGDFNVPETTLSGMLGGMPVAVAAGHALERLRLGSGLAVAIPLEHVVWAGVRDLDPLERDRFEEHGVRQLLVADLRTRSSTLRREMDRLARETDVIYVHIDMDVLDPAEVPGHSLAVPDGPTSEELAGALEVMFGYPEALALGIASTPAGSDDPRGVSRQAALNLIRGAVAGVRSRQ
jgi:arginase